MKSLIVFPTAILLALSSSAQVIDKFVLTKPTKVNPINTLSFSLQESKVTQLHEAKGEKLVIKTPFIVVNADSAVVDHMRIRGTSSSYLRRKSFNIKVKDKVRFGILPDTFSLDKFYAVSMNMDKNYIRNKVSYNVLRSMDISTPHNCYTNLVINNNSEGLYAIFDPPEQFAIQRCNAKVVIRRGYNQAIDGWNHNDISEKEAASLRKKFQGIYADILRKNHGEELYQKLNEVLDLDGYFMWLAFNHLFQNGDYSDELYLMWNGAKSRYEIIPWDFDDLLLPPHEGLEKRNAILGGKLIYSSEDALDVAIAKDDFLYKKYLLQYKQLLERLTPTAFSEILNRVYQDVYPYFQQSEIIAQSQHDRGGATNLDKLETDIRDISAYVNTRIVIYREKVNAMLK